jgi:hypothetical protein
MAIEKWMLVNLTKSPLSPGFLNMTVVYPGKKKDLIASDVTKDEVRQSQTIHTYLKKGFAHIERMVDGELVSTVTGDNITDLNDIPSENINEGSSKKKKVAKPTDKLHETAPVNIDPSSFHLYVDGDSLMVTAKDAKGRTVKAKLGDFK